MRRGLWIGVVLAGCVTAPTLGRAQAAPPATSQKPAQPSAKPDDANPFPGDISNVPVMGTAAAAALPPEPDEAGAGERFRLPGGDVDPVRSPDDSAADEDAGAPSDSSSSQTGLDKLLPSTADDRKPQGRRRKLAVEAPEHTETASEDIQVGQYELDRKNWKAALSRFESAMVLSPDEPEVYWGLAECERHMGDLAAARGYYQKVAEYDPDSRHGKEAIKALKSPEIANAKAASPEPSPAK